MIIFTPNSVIKSTEVNSNFAEVSPIGTVNTYAGTTEPSGWLFCYGQAISRTTYAGLFAVISTTYGTGDGSTTFNLPDMRGRVVAGQDDMGGTSANRLTNQVSGVDGDVLGASGGRETTRHAFMEPGINTNAFQDTGNNYINSVRGDIDTYLTGGGSTATAVQIFVRNVGGNVGSNGANAIEVRNSQYTSTNIQPTIILNYIIKT